VTTVEQAHDYADLWADYECPHCKAKPKGWEHTKTRRGWGHPRQGPHKPWATIYPNGAYYVEGRHWLDHLFRVIRNDGTVFIAEPYDLGRQDLDDLNLLREQGWKVEISGHSIHHPRTVRVQVWR
jgi:hypothetical protein